MVIQGPQGVTDPTTLLRDFLNKMEEWNQGKFRRCVETYVSGVPREAGPASRRIIASSVPVCLVQSLFTNRVFKG